VSAKFTSLVGITAIVVAAGVSAGCGDMATQGRSPVQLMMLSLLASSGAQPDEQGATLQSDVITNVPQTINGQQVSVATVFNDHGSATFALVLKDPGNIESPTTPSALNQVTITRYRVTYRRTDGRNTPGVDVPYPFDSAVTLSVTTEGNSSTAFQIVRHVAKQEAPLKALANNPDIISTIAEVTFYGQDQAGNEISAAGSIGIDFGNFGDPQ